MRFLDLRHQFRDFAVFSLPDIRKAEPDFDVRRLVEWQEKGYIKKIIKKFYVFSDLEITEPALFVIANAIYVPAYISLEMALSYYHLIPESVYGLTAVTTKKTATFSTPLGDFIYRSLKPELFFGYTPIPYLKQRYLMADIEKALLDYFYLNPNLRTEADFTELRFNQEELSAQINQDKLGQYLTAFGNRSLRQRVFQFLQFIRYADS